ncbi:MAG: LUD domain-containing protein [Chitinophagaceae bacterium]|nr:LUD domain-containing protein [Chitinophagaceae bacterium]
MAVSAAKENILKRIRQALSNPVPLPFPQSEGVNSVFLPATDELEILFAQKFTSLQGRFAFCTDENDMIAQVNALIGQKQWTKIFCNEDRWNAAFSNTINLPGCDASVTGCELLVARTGTIVLSAAQQSGRTVSVYAPVHICIAYTSQLVYDIKDALVQLKEKYAGNMPSLISFATGPSRTADIEKTLVTGVHGPKEVYCFLVDA